MYEIKDSDIRAFRAFTQDTANQKDRKLTNKLIEKSQIMSQLVKYL